MKEQKIDIGLFQETRRPEGTDEVNGVHFFFHGKKKENRSGVAIALGPRALQSRRLAGRPDPIRITSAEAGRIIALPLRITQKKNKKSRELNYLFISVHFPHTGYNNKEFDNTCNELSKLLDSQPDDVIPIIGADLNANIGTRNQHDEDIGSTLGPHGIPYVNDRGRLALSFLRRQGLCSVSSFSNKRISLLTTTFTMGVKHKAGTYGRLTLC